MADDGAAPKIPLNPLQFANLSDSLQREDKWNAKEFTKEELQEKFLRIAVSYFTMMSDRFPKDRSVREVVDTFTEECVAHEEDDEMEASGKAGVARLFIRGWYKEMKSFYRRIMMHDPEVFAEIKNDFIKDIDMGGKYDVMTEGERADAFKTIHTLTIIARKFKGEDPPVVDRLSKVVKEFAGKPMGEKNTVKFTKSIWKALMEDGGSMSSSLERVLESAGGIEQVMKTMKDPKQNPFKGKNKKKAKKIVKASVSTLVDLFFGDSDGDDSDSGDEGETDDSEVSDEEDHHGGGEVAEGGEADEDESYEGGEDGARAGAGGGEAEDDE